MAPWIARGAPRIFWNISLEIQMNLREKLSDLILDKKKMEEDAIKFNQLELEAKRIYNSCLDKLNFMLDKIDTLDNEKKLEIQNQINILD